MTTLAQDFRSRLPQDTIFVHVIACETGVASTGKVTTVQVKVEPCQGEDWTEAAPFTMSLRGVTSSEQLVALLGLQDSEDAGEYVFDLDYIPLRDPDEVYAERLRARAEHAQECRPYGIR